MFQNTKFWHFFLRSVLLISTFTLRTHSFSKGMSSFHVKGNRGPFCPPPFIELGNQQVARLSSLHPYYLTLSPLTHPLSQPSGFYLSYYIAFNGFPFLSSVIFQGRYCFIFMGIFKATLVSCYYPSTWEVR